MLADRLQQDLAIGENGTDKVAIRFGNGAGGFAPGSDVTALTGSPVSDVVIGDFNNDGFQDFAATSYNFGNPSFVSIRLGDGAGGFSAAKARTTTRKRQRRLRCSMPESAMR